MSISVRSRRSAVNMADAVAKSRSSCVRRDSYESIAIRTLLSTDEKYASPDSEVSVGNMIVQMRETSSSTALNLSSAMCRNRLSSCNCSSRSCSGGGLCNPVLLVVGFFHLNIEKGNAALRRLKEDVLRSSSDVFDQELRFDVDRAIPCGSGDPLGVCLGVNGSSIFSGTVIS